MISTFDFLQEFEELHMKATDFEMNIKKDLKVAVASARCFFEEIIKFLVIQNNVEQYMTYGHCERLKALEDEGVLKEEFSIGIDVCSTSISSYEDLNVIDIAQIKLLHEVLFELSVYIKKDYSTEAFKSEKYSGKLIDMFYGYISENHISDIVKIDGQDKLYGSYLLYQLAKLNDSSKEVIQNSNELDKFKNYLHVERDIQLDLEKKIRELAYSDKSQLILLCGSVGDGKSHLLAYMNENHSEIMDKYRIHNDATESFDPYKSSVETLIELLMPFSDENIHNSTEKIIVAINLGVLNNFLENQFTKENYKELSKFIRDSKIFDEYTLKSNFSRDMLHLISFSDYQMFELNEQGVSSKYFSEIFEKIVDESKDNPFYRAYLNDLDDENNSVIMYNYRLFQQVEIRDSIVDILIRAVIGQKAIFSTRALFNFIYDILVPSNIEEKINLKSVIEITDNLLPNLLFASKDKSSLLKIINKFDPINIRTNKIDLMLIELSNCNNVKSFFRNNFEMNCIDDWVNGLEDLGSFYDLTQQTKNLMIKTLLRFGRLVSSIQNTEEDLIYKEYIKYLYNFNIGNHRELKDLFDQVKRGIFAWRGGPTPNGISLYVYESLDEIRVAQNLRITPNIFNLNLGQEYAENRFKNNITIAFKESNSKKVVSLEIDYSLYVIIRNVLKGQRPSKKDKEHAIKFIEFIDKLIKLSNIGEEILVYDLKDRLTFKLEIDSTFGGFIFEKE